MPRYLPIPQVGGEMFCRGIVRCPGFRMIYMLFVLRHGFDLAVCRRKLRVNREHR
jgi:hypothetical protein